LERSRGAQAPARARWRQRGRRADSMGLGETRCSLGHEEPRHGTPQRIKVTVSQLPSMLDELELAAKTRARTHEPRACAAAPQRSAWARAKSRFEPQLRHRHTLASAYDRQSSYAQSSRARGSAFVQHGRDWRRGAARRRRLSRRAPASRDHQNQADGHASDDSRDV
jgi:hypothetical protein